MTGRCHGGFGALRLGLSLALLASASPPVLAQEQPAGADADAARDEAHERFNLGLALMENENWEAARLEFERSLELFPTRSALFNLGMCQKALHRYLQALETFEGWLAAYAESAPAQEHATIEEAIAELRSFVGELVVIAEPPGAQVAVDGAPVGVTPLDSPVPVEVGIHTVEVTAAGHEGALRQITVISRQRVEVAVELIPRTPAEPVPPEGPGPVEPAETLTGSGPTPEESGGGEAGGGDEAGGMSSAWFWTAASAAAAAGIAGAVTGSMALVRDGDFADAVSHCQAGEHAACRDGRAIASECDDWELATNVLLPAAGAFAAAALVLVFFTEFGGGAVEEPPAAVFAGPTVGATGADGAAIGVSWRF